MKTEENRRLYWGWFASFVALWAVAYAISSAIERLVQSWAHGTLIVVAVVLIPMPIMGVFGLIRDCFPGYWYGEIIRGRQAIVWNSLTILLYVAVLGYTSLRS